MSLPRHVADTWAFSLSGGSTSTTLEKSEINKLMADDVADMHPVVGDTFIDLTNVAVLAVASMTYRFVIDRRMAAGFRIPFPAGLGCYSSKVSGFAEKM